MNDRPRRIDPDLVLLHWLMALLFLLAITGIVGRGLLPSGHALRPGMRQAHILIGQLIFVFSLVRLVVRLRSPPRPVPGLSRPAVWAGRTVHTLLYGVMLLQPVSGVLFMQAGDKSVSFFGWTLPTLVGSDPALHFEIKDLHVLTGNVFYVLLSLHVVAALWHHLVLRDATLRRMLDLRRRRRARAKVWAAFDESMRSEWMSTRAGLEAPTVAEMRRQAWHRASTQAGELQELARPRPGKRHRQETVD